MIKFRPLFLYDPAMEQAWLEDQAKRGWFVYEYKSLYASFWQEDPREVRFRLEPAREGVDRPDVETQETYRTMGWKYVCPLDHSYHVWRCDDPDAPELNTDPEVQAFAYEHLGRQSRKGYRIIAAVWIVALVLHAAMNLWAEDYFIKSVQSWQPWYIWGPRTAGVVICVLLLAFMEWNHQTYLRTLRAGVAQPQRRPYRLSFVMSGVMLVVLAAMAVFWTASILQPNSWSFRSQSAYREPIPYVEVPEADREHEVKAIRWQNWRTRQQWQVLQGDWDVLSRYYEFYTIGMAEKMTKQLAERDSLQNLSRAEVDEVWWLPENEHGVQRLLVRHGSVVLEVSYFASGDLMEYLPAYEVLVKEG